jgi:hypothetical protein
LRLCLRRRRVSEVDRSECGGLYDYWSPGGRMISMGMVLSAPSRQRRRI